MKTAFSTVGCPDWSWNEIFAVAKDLGFDGIEVRGIGSELFAPAAQPFAGDEAEKTAARLAAAGMQIPVYATNAVVGTGDLSAAMTEARAYLALAARTGTPYIRVLVTPEPQPGPADLPRAAECVRALCDEATAGVGVLIETNGVLAESARMREFIESVGRDNAGVLWDVHHPFRFFGEAPEQTMRNLGRLVRHVHIKDSVAKDGKTCYRMMGYGDVPVFDALSLLEAQGFDGFVSLEWVKRWNPDLQEPGIVFAHFANYIGCLLRQLRP